MEISVIIHVHITAPDALQLALYKFGLLLIIIVYYYYYTLM